MWFRERASRDVELLQKERPSLSVIGEDVYPHKVTHPEEQTVEAGSATATHHRGYVHTGGASSMPPVASFRDWPPPAWNRVENPSRAHRDPDTVSMQDALYDAPVLRRSRRL